MTKAKLFSLFRFVPTEEVRQQTNIIIAENRQIDLEVAKRKHYVRPKEVQQVKEFFGYED